MAGFERYQQTDFEVALLAQATKLGIDLTHFLQTRKAYIDELVGGSGPSYRRLLWSLVDQYTTRAKQGRPPTQADFQQSVDQFVAQSLEQKPATQAEIEDQMQSAWFVIAASIMFNLVLSNPRGAKNKVTQLEYDETGHDRDWKAELTQLYTYLFGLGLLEELPSFITSHPEMTEEEAALINKARQEFLDDMLKRQARGGNAESQKSLGEGTDSETDEWSNPSGGEQE